MSNRNPTHAFVETEPDAHGAHQAPVDATTHSATMYLSCIVPANHNGVLVLTPEADPPDSEELRELQGDIDATLRLMAAAIVVIACVAMAFLLSGSMLPPPDGRTASQIELPIE